MVGPPVTLDLVKTDTNADERGCLTGRAGLRERCEKKEQLVALTQFRSPKNTPR